MTKSIIIAGEAAEGSGALVGWRGQGSLALRDIRAALEAAGCPSDWAPPAESCKAHAGEAVRALNARGYIVRAARRTDQDRRIARATGSTWEARWTVSVSSASTAAVGESAGRVVLSFELRGAELTVAGDDVLGREVTEIFNAKRDAEAFQAGRVTEWLSRTLQRHLGATRLGLGWYVPAGSRPRANALCMAMASVWGCAWICPLLPVATSEELKIGVARGLVDDVAAIEKTLANERNAATEAKLSEISPAVAARLLRSVTEVTERVAAYRVLCGPAVDPAIARLQGLAAQLGTLADASSQRFALLELAEGPAAPAPAPEVSPAERAAERAMEERTGFQPARRAMPMPLPRAEDRPSQVDELGNVMPVPTTTIAINAATAHHANAYRVPAPPTMELGDDIGPTDPDDQNAADSRARFDLLELD